MRLTGLILALLVGWMSVGFTINKHYCCGQLKSTSVYIFKAPPGCCAGAPAAKKCCHDELELHKLDEQAKPAVSALKLGSETLLMQQPLPLLSILLSEAPPYSHIRYKPPLSWADIPLTVQAFLI